MIPNADQLAASKALSGRVLISAGAGSGKTRTLVTRFLNALHADESERWESAAVDEVLAITYTEKAAGEIAERVRRALHEAGLHQAARDIDAAWTGTIHWFCARVLRRYALEAGVDPAFSVADNVVAEHLKEQAFEDACSQLSAGPESGLLAEYDFGKVFSAVRALADRMRTETGGRLPEIVVESPRSAREILCEALEVFSAGRDSVRACGDDRAQATKLLDGCCSTVDLLEAVDCSALSESDIATEVWQALARFTPSGSATTIREVVAETKQYRERLMAEAATAIVAPYVAELAELATSYLAAYQGLKREQGLLDFDDLQTEMLALVRSRPDVLEALRHQLRMVMVDEFQDTNELQLAIVEAIAHDDLCTVGDEQQSIYGFRGAAVEVYRRHNKEMREAGARTFELALNYRSHPGVLAFVNHVFAGLFGEAMIRLQPGRESYDPLGPDEPPRVDVTFVRAGRGADGRGREAHAVAQRFAELRDVHGVDTSDMVVLLRSYTHAEAYAEALRRQGFSAAIVGGSRFFDIPSVAVCRALLRVIVNTSDDDALAKLIVSDAVGLSDDAMWAIGRRRVRGVETPAPEAEPLWESVMRVAGESELAPRDLQRIEVLRRTVDAAKGRIGSRRLSEVLLTAVEDLAYDLTLLGGGEEGRLGFANVVKLASMADAFETSIGSGPASFLAYLDARERYKEHTTPASAAGEGEPPVRIMSIHSSKGLEFPVVAVAELGAREPSDGPIALWTKQEDKLAVAMRLPSAAPAKKTEDTYSELYGRIQEESKTAERQERQRLFYVACTRAEKMLILSGCGGFSKPAEESPDNPIEWVRGAFGAGPVGEESVKEVDISGHACTLRTVVADEWSEPGIGAGGSLATARREDSVACRTDAGRDAHAHGESTQPAPAAVPDRLSYSDLSLFESCEKRFWATKLARVGSLRLLQDHRALRFGTVVHAALELSLSGAELDANRYATLCKAFGLEISEAEAAVTAVETFFNSSTARELRAHDRILPEWPFAFEVDRPPHPFTLVGSIDAYGRSATRALIVDFKTGGSGEPKDLSLRYRLQASVYALAAMRDGCSEVRVVFARPQVTDASGQMQEVAFDFGEADAETIESELAARVAQIGESTFSALDTWDQTTCGDCPVAGSLCPRAAPAGHRKT